MSSSSRLQKSVLFTSEDDKDMLDSLKGLSIKGFHDCNEANTPSSTNASLPTPPALRSSLVLLASPADSFEGWYTPQAPIQQPGAPLIKDLDSFTEGTGQGSFDFLPLTAAEESLPLIFHPPDTIDTIDRMGHTVNHNANILPANPLTLDLLPSPSNLEDAVLAWRENVVNTSLPPPLPTLELPVKKRRRSLTPGGDDDERRTRVWSPSQLSTTFHIEPHVVRYPTKHIEPKTPD